jgi:hypothetical protein
MFGIAALFLTDVFIDLFRMDKFVYGRYVEILYGPILAAGAVSLSRNIKNLIIPALFCLCVGAFLEFVVSKQGDYFLFAEFNSVWLSPFYLNDKVYFLAAAIVSIIFGVFFIKFPKPACVFFAVLNLLLGYRFIAKIIIPKGDYNHAYAEQIRTIDKKAYYIGAKTVQNPPIAQFLLYDRPLLAFDSTKYLDYEFPEEHYLISEQISREILAGYRFENLINGMFFLRPDKNADGYFLIPESVGDDSFFGEPITLSPGMYNIRADFVLEEVGEETDSEKVATIVAFSNYPKVGYGSKVINYSDFEDGSYTFDFSVDVKLKNYDFEVTVFVEKEIKLRIKNVYIY